MTCEEFRTLVSRFRTIPTAAEVISVVVHARKCQTCRAFVITRDNLAEQSMTPEQIEGCRQLSNAVAANALARLREDPELQDMMKGANK